MAKKKKKQDELDKKQAKKDKKAGKKNKKKDKKKEPPTKIASPMGLAATRDELSNPMMDTDSDSDDEPKTIGIASPMAAALRSTKTWTSK